MTSQTLTTEKPGADTAARQRWMRTLALADPDALDAAWQGWEPKPAVQAIRGPEAGLVMVRARIGGGGERFNLGEATVTRATVRLHGGPLAAAAVGTSYVLGTDLEHARLAADLRRLAVRRGAARAGARRSRRAACAGAGRA